MKALLVQIRNALLIFIMLGLVCGVLYPFLVTAVSQYVFPEQTAGSLIYREDGSAVGSRLIGQNFTRPEYFHGRPSGNEGGADNAMISGGTNDGPASFRFLERVRDRVHAEWHQNRSNAGDVPQDLVTASGSGLDPDITPEAAFWQAERIAAARGIKKENVEQLIKHQTRKPLLHFLGTKRVNVLEINLELDRLYPVRSAAAGKSGKK